MKRVLGVRLAYVMAGIVRPLVHNISLYLLIYCAAESKLRKPIFVRQASAGLVTISFLSSSGELYV